MKIHVRTLTEEQKEILQKLTAFLLTNSQKEVKIQEYGPFSSVEVETNYTNNLSSIFTEESYTQGNYVIHIWETNNRENCFVLPLSSIDTIYNL